jgi:general secretion pathway protein L
MPQQVLGIALEDNHITAVRLTGHSRAYDVTLALRQPLPVHDDPEEHARLQRETMRQVVEAHGLRGDTVLASLPAHHAILRNLTLPFRDLRRIRQMITFALDEHMPFEPEDVVVDFRPLPIQQVPQQTQVLVAGMPKREIVGDLALFRSAGLEPSVLDLDVFSLANAAVLGSNGVPGKTALLCVHPERTLLTLLHDGAPLFARSLAQGMPTDSGDLPDPQKLGKQLQHTLYACEHAVQVAYEPDLLLLFGADRDQLAHLAVGLSEATGLQTHVWRLEAPGYKPANGGSASPDPGPAGHAIALGAALRGLHRQVGGLNLRRGEFAPHSNLRELRGKLIALGVLAVAVGGLGLGNLYLQNHYKARRLAQLQDSIAKGFSDALPSTRMVQPVAQMREKMRDLDKRLRAFGGLTGAQLSRLQILRELSARVPASLGVEVDNLNISGDVIELSASTASYDNVVKLQSAFTASPLLSDVTINNTRQGANNTVQFKLSLRASSGLE